MDLEDFEALYKKYWDMELDADQFGKNKIAYLVSKLDIPMVLAKPTFELSSIVKNYQNSSQTVKYFLKQVIESIKEMKRQGMPFEDIQDSPVVKQYLSRLENFI